MQLGYPALGSWRWRPSWWQRRGLRLRPGVCQGVERKKCGRPSNCENWRQSGKFCDAVECGVPMVEC